MKRMFKAKRSKLSQCGIFDLKRDRSSFKVRLGDKFAEVVLNNEGFRPEYEVLGIKVPRKGYVGVEKAEYVSAVNAAIDYVAHISRVNNYDVKMLLSGEDNRWTQENV